MMPLLRSLLDATGVTLHERPRSAARRLSANRPAVCADNFYSRKELILNQYHRRVQKTWPRTGPRHGHEAVLTVHQPHAFRRASGSLDLLAVRNAVPPFLRDRDRRKGGQQTIHRDERNWGCATAELLERNGSLQRELAAPGTPQGLEARPGSRQLAQRVRKRAHVETRRAHQTHLRAVAVEPLQFR